MNGLAIRTSKLLDAGSGRSVMLAFDHGGGGIPTAGADVPRILDILTTAGAQAVLLGPGISRRAGARFARPGAPALITALDVPIFSDLPGGHGPMMGHVRGISAARALAEGATAAKVVIPMGPGDGDAIAQTVSVVTGASEEAHAVGLPLMIEPALWGARALEIPVGPEQDAVIEHSARMAWELGADMIKIHAPQDPDVLAAVVAHSDGPVFVLGGNPGSSELFLRDVDTWIAAGATGVVVGRNVWSRSDPAAMTAALGAVVHARSLDDALAIVAAAGEA